MQNVHPEKELQLKNLPLQELQHLSEQQLDKKLLKHQLQKQPHQEEEPQLKNWLQQPGEQHVDRSPQQNLLSGPILRQLQDEKRQHNQQTITKLQQIIILQLLLGVHQSEPVQMANTIQIKIVPNITFAITERKHRKIVLGQKIAQNGNRERFLASFFNMKHPVISEKMMHSNFLWSFCVLKVWQCLID